MKEMPATALMVSAAMYWMLLEAWYEPKEKVTYVLQCIKSAPIEWWSVDTHVYRVALSITVASTC